MSTIARLGIRCLLALCWLGCGDDDSAPSDHDDGGAEVVGGANSGGDEDDGGTDVSGEGSCDDEDAGGCEEGKHCSEGRCVWDSCGDGIVNGSEECDDGNELTGDECNPGCKRISPRCMDGVQQEGEECDDGNFFNADACSNSCTVNECGNGRIELEEECDDGNALDSDGCSNDCTENRCRNGRVDPGEECDDGNQDHRDGCTNACKIVACGNTKLEGDEECDDGNQVDDDACSKACTENVCGNLRVDPGEVCDGTTATAGCSEDCQEILDNSECLACLEANCRDFDFFGIDVYALCYENSDATYAQLCQDVVSCVWSSDCLTFDGTDPDKCICGSATPTMCQSNMGIDGPCFDAIFAASTGRDFEEFLVRQRDTEYPSGSAHYLLYCAGRACMTECSQ